MLDGAKIKMMKKQMEKKDAEITELKNKNAALEEEKETLLLKTKEERKKVEEAADMAAATIKEYRDKILEVEKLHQKFLRLMEETKRINETYREKFEELIHTVQKAEEGD